MRKIFKECITGLIVLSVGLTVVLAVATLFALFPILSKIFTFLGILAIVLVVSWLVGVMFEDDIADGIQSVRSFITKWKNKKRESKNEEGSL